MKLSAYSSYKPSGVEWLGEVPAHWEVKSARLGYSIQLGKMLQPEQGNETEMEVPYLKSQHVQWEAIRIDELPTMWASATEEIKYGVKDGDLLVCEGGDVGRAGIVINPPPGTIIQNALHRVRSYKKNNLRFLMYVLEHAATQGWFEILCNRSTIAHFTGEKFGALRLPMPSVEEQQTIADFLDAQTAKIDTLLAKKRQLIDKLKEKRSALIARSVTRGLPPDAAQAAGLESHPAMKDSGVEWLGSIPMIWQVERLRPICQRVTDGAHISPDLSADDFPFVSTVDIADGKIDMLQCLRTSRECYDYLVRTGCKPFYGDVLFSKDGTVGTTAVVDFDTDFAVASSLVIISPIRERLDSSFLDYWLNNSLLQQEVALQMTGAALRRISVEKVARLPVLMPPLKEQQAIAAYLDLETARIDQLTAKVEAAISRLTEYRQVLITAVVTGKIDVRARTVG